MAEIDDAISNINVGELASSALDSVSSLVYPVLWTILGLCVVGLLLWYLSYRHRVRVRLLTSKGYVPYDDKAREVSVDGVIFWRLLKLKQVVPIPPSSALISIGRDFLGKPKFASECYFSEETGIVWADDTPTRADFQNRVEILEEVGGVERKVVRDAFQPFTTQERALHVNGITKAVLRKKKGVLDIIKDVAVPLAFIGFMIIVLVFWEDIAKPSKEMAQVNLAMLEENRKISEQNARMVSVLAGQVDAGELVIQQTVPPDAAPGGGG